MGLIKKAAELEVSTSVQMMIYGQAGTGKTSLALSAPNPLLLDFDNGFKRVNIAHTEGVDVVQITSWRDIKELFKEDLTPYQTIVVDTIGKMMDYIISYKCADRPPRVQDWTGINQEFQWFTRELRMLGKNVIFIAHRDTRREGDETVFVPALREKNYNAIVTDIDLLGYMEMRNENGVQHRTITFDPTSRNDGKNTCNLPAVMNIPTVLDARGEVIAPNTFITTHIIEPYVEMIDRKRELRKEYDALLADITSQIQAITTAEQANEFAGAMKDMKHVGSSLQKARQLFASRVQELGLKFDKETKSYVDE